MNMIKLSLPGFYALGLLSVALPALAQAPEFRSTWRAMLPADSRRIAVADLSGDGKPRLLALGKESNLTVISLTGAAPAKEMSVDLGPNATSFVAGRFSKGKPALIVVPGAVFLKEGDKLTRK